MKVRLRLVELEGEKYAIQQRCYFRWLFHARNDLYIWGKTPAYVRSWCVMDSLTEAEEAFMKIIELIKQKNSRIVVVKVIKSVKV